MPEMVVNIAKVLLMHDRACSISQREQFLGHLFSSGQMNARLHALWPAAGALAISVAAAVVCSTLRVPLAWMIGPMLSVAAARMCGVHFTAPRRGRQAGQWIIGTALGLYFTPAVVERLGGIARRTCALRRRTASARSSTP